MAEKRLPPQNIEAEKSVLGALLLDSEAMIKIGDILQPEDFYQPKHCQIFQAMVTLFEKDSPIDTITLADKLKDKKILKKVGGVAYLTELANSVPSSAHIVRHAKIITDKATLRRLISAASSIIETAFDSEEGSEQVLDRAESQVFKLSRERSSDRFVAIEEVLEESFDRIDRLHKDKAALRGIPTNFRDLDSLLSGLQSSDLVILAGRPSMGKTALALNIGANVATKNNLPVGIFSLEMSREQLVDRLICSEAGVDSWKLRTGNLSDDDFVKIGQAMGTLSEAPIFIEDSPVASVMEIRAKARRLHAEHKIQMLIVDYIQLIEGNVTGGGEQNRVQEMSNISRALKALARELNLPVLALSQLSRAVEQREPQIPRLSDLRESGSIEQDSDVVIFIYREDYYNPETENKNISDIIISKHRNGPTGQVQLFFDKPRISFQDLEKERSEPTPKEDREEVEL
jgi:replicative DNA helicase